MTNERYRIMIVDDDEDLRALVRTALSQKFEVVEAVDGLDALNKLPDHQPDLAVIDFEMPLMSGLDLCAAIRRHNDFRGIPVLFLSAHGSKENMKKGYDAGADLFMTKPIEPSRMIKNIEFTIEHDKPPLRRKKYTIEVLRQMASGAGEAQDISEEVMGDPVLRNTTSPPPKPATVKRAPEPAAKPASPPAPEPARAPQPEAIRPMPEAKPVKSPEPKPAPAITPPAPGPMKLARQSQPAPAAGPQKARVMIVDNEEDARQLMELALRQNYEITTANDGLDAIEKIVRRDDAAHERFSSPSIPPAQSEFSTCAGFDRYGPRLAARSRLRDENGGE
ncbi:response regulator [Candidatus Sumerlaeota bacterium]|nr:response regulator [Candidatus Sumerlaeota bacterium]